MHAQHERILGIIADLAVDGREVDEFSVAQTCGAIPEELPRHAWVNHPCRAELLHAFSVLDQAKCIYVTRRGYWGLHLTKRGQHHLEERPASVRHLAPVTALILANDAPTPPPAEYQQWAGPRPTPPHFAPRQDHFYSTMALAIAALGVLLIFAFGQGAYSPVARKSAAAAASTTVTPVAALTLPLLAPTTTAAPTSQPTAPPAKRTFAVANTGGEGVYLRRAPRNGDRLAAWPELALLREVGAEQMLDGTTWRHVRAPDGTEGYVPAQYTTVVP